MREFDSDKIRRLPVIEPTPKCFPDPYKGTVEDGEALFTRVCRYIEIDRSRIELRWIENEAGRAGSDTSTPLAGRRISASGTYEIGSWSVAERIRIDVKNLAEPMQFVATAAHELCHAHLMGDGRVTGEEADNEPLTDLLTVFLGMGIFGANACVKDKGFTTLGGSGWVAGTLGYLPQDTWAYALALFSWIRGEEKPQWVRHLRPDIRSVFRRSMRYLVKNGVGERSLLD